MQARRSTPDRATRSGCGIAFSRNRVIAMRESMSIHEIVLPDTEPETEWILGRAVRKVSPRRTHALLQGKLWALLARWAEGRGEVGTEWRFRIAPAGQIRRPLVPDVSYVSYERLRDLEGDALELPPFAPDVAVEVLSPGWRAAYLEHKVAVYLAGGSLLVIVVDPAQREARLYDANGMCAVRENEVIEHSALPGFALPLTELFAVLQRPML
ncbi:MAG TPA: Uma2 family endonuclease [Candidatus Elarobacter sp.]|nr:Uma2 family endonuclease [Candidatus Elarobacter sp.]